jgi:hypothetical protein
MSCGISRDKCKRSYGVESSFGAASTKKKKRGGDREDSLNKADDTTLARAGEPPIRPPSPGVSTQGGPSSLYKTKDLGRLEALREGMSPQIG